MAVHILSSGQLRCNAVTEQSSPLAGEAPAGVNAHCAAAYEMSRKSIVVKECAGAGGACAKGR